MTQASTQITEDAVKKLPWFVPKEDIKDPLPVLTNEQFFEISRQLENFHSIFYKFWEVGKPAFSRDVPTAGVCFDVKSGRFVSFVFNPEFWNWCDEHTKLFVIAHEMLHLILNHGLRAKDCDQKHIANACLDLVINRLLVEKFGFSRKKVKAADDVVWKDTLFTNNPFYKGPEPEDDKAFEYYYLLAKKYFPTIEVPGKAGKGKSVGQGQGNVPGKDQGKNQVPQLVDDHKGLSENEFDDLIEEMNETLTDEEKDDIKEIVEEHFQSEEDNPDDIGDKANNTGGKEAGKGAGGHWTFASIDARKVKKQKKWETVIKKWAMMKIRDEFKDVEQWARMHRRFAMMDNGGLMLPTEMEVEDEFFDEDKIEIILFQDTSGSCAHLKDRFFKAGASLPPEKFEVHLCCFDTQVYETTFESKKLYGFGGTSFPCLEQYIQAQLKAGKFKKYPTVFVITDGYGDVINPELPQNWYWFLSENYNYYIPQKSNVFMLSDYE